jgi:hypothetical protein
MFRKMLMGTAIAAVLAFGIPTHADAQTSPAKKHLKKAGQKMKQAGKATGEAAKATGSATKETAKATGEAAKVAGEKTEDAAKKTGQVTKDAAKEAATGTKRAAKTVKRKMTPDTTSATCKDGTVQTGKTKTTACANHGGVKG